MNEKKRETILKIMAITAIFLCVYPLTSLVRISLFKEGREFLDGLFYLAVIFSTFIAVSLIMRKSYTKKNKVLSYLFLVIPIIASLKYFSFYGILSIIFGTFIAAILCFYTIRVYFNEYDYLMSGFKFYVGIVMLLFALIFSTYIEDLKYLKNLFYIFTFLYAFIVLVIKNQSNLDSIFSKRFDKASGIPVKMRSHNINKIIVFFLLIMVVFCFRGVLIAGLQGLASLLGLILNALWNFINFIIDKLQDIVYVEDPDLSGLPDMDYDDEGNGANSIITAIFNIIGYLFLAFIIYKVFNELIINRFIPFLKNTYKYLIEKIINFLEKKECKVEKTYYYTDSIERVLPSDILRKSKETKETPNINKALKQINKIENPKEKVRYLYGLILKFMSAKGVAIKKSYSTGEIYKKAEEIDQLGKPFSEITKVYDRVKYGDKMPNDSEVDNAKDNTLKSIEIIKRV